MIKEINKIYNEDNLITMAKMPNDFIDLIITSPPYNKAGYEGKIRNAHKNDSWKKRNIAYNDNPKNDFMNEKDYKNNQIKVLNEMYRIIKPNGSIFYNHKVRIANHKASHPIEWILESKLNFRQQIIWNRKNSPAVSPIRYLPTTELIFWLTKTNIQPNFNRKKDLLHKGEVWSFSAKPNKLHPAPFPEELPKNIINCIKDKKNFLIYDPYAGIGTTLKVAAENGFNFIGSEIVKEYIDIANDKILNTTKKIKLQNAQKTLF
tara:strand:+ start:178 stop:963 length:786 start_codon:yes stop_codon:yes gene_type:complete